jgi:3-oxoacyl-[acyl-carrier-protein] synthase-3
MKLKSVGIIGLGYYVPQKIMTNADFEKIVDTSDEWIKSMTGIEERHHVEKDEATSDMCTEAAKKALINANLTIDDIDLIIVSTVTPDYLAQSASCIVQKKLGGKQIPAFDVSAGCSGLVYSLTVANGLIKSGTYNKILVIGGEVLSKVTNMQDRSTCVLFGDGAAALVVSEVEENYGILSSYIGAEGEDDHILSIPAGGSKKPNTEETIKNRENFVVMNGPEVFKFAVRAFPNATKKAIALANLKIADINLLIPHQANIRIIESAMRRLGIPSEKVFINIQKYGNTSSASTGICMGEALAEGKIKKGDIVVLTAFGSGLTYGSIVFRWAY